MRPISGDSGMVHYPTHRVKSAQCPGAMSIRNDRLDAYGEEQQWAGDGMEWAGRDAEENDGAKIL